jgi:hypothetical protein
VERRSNSQENRLSASIEGREQVMDGNAVSERISTGETVTAVHRSLASPDRQLQANEAYMYTLHTEVNQSRKGETRVVGSFRRGFGLLTLTCPEAGVHCLGCLNGRRSRGIRCLANASP